MVDTGAKNSIISEEILRGRSAFQIRPSESAWCSVNRQNLPAHGETSLSVRFKDSIVDLKRVVVMRDVMYPLVLGVDWITTSGVIISTRNGQLMVDVPAASAPILPPGSTRIESQVEKEEDFESASEDIRLLGAVASEPRRSWKQRPNIFLKPNKRSKIAGFTTGFVEARIPSAKDGLWMVSTAGSSREGQEWISPSCLLQSVKGVVSIPVSNLNQSPFGWTRTRGLWKAESVSAEQVKRVPDEEEAINLCAAQPTEMNHTFPGVDELNFGDQLSAKESHDLYSLLQDHPACFSSIKGHTNMAEHRIETGDAHPVHSASYRVSEAERRIIQAQVKDMIEDDIVSPSSSPWSSPVVLIKKKNGDLRFCIDYRKLNAVTQKDVYPLPRIEDVLGRLSGAKYFTSLDLQMGFLQVPLAKEHREKSAFITPDGLFEFKRLPFGLCGAPPTFQRLMDRVLDGLKWTQCLVYMDDILVFGGDFNQHNERLHRVLNAIENAGLTLNLKKCTFGTSSVSYLGHRICLDGISPDPAKIEAIINFPRPDTVTKLRAFLGLASFYRRFIKGFAGIAQPLHALLKKGADVCSDWKEVHDAAIEELKEKLTSAPVLVYDDGESEVELFTDASSKGIGAVLQLKGEGSGARPVTFISRRLTPAEEKYHVNELECLALVWALTKLRHHVYGRTLVVKTDSSVLRWLSQKRDISGKFARWIVTLQEYSLDIHHLSGTANVVADALSRAPTGFPEETDPADRVLGVIQPAGCSPRQLALLQHADSDVRYWVLKLQGFNDGQEGNEVEDQFILHAGILYKKSRKPGRPHLLVVPSILRRDLLMECHDSPNGGHSGVEKTYARLSQRYWWRRMKKTVKAYVSSCEFCQPFKSRVGFPPGKLCPIKPPRQPFEVLGIDHLGPFHLSKARNAYLIVCIDYLTRWIEVQPVPDTSTEFIREFLEKGVFLRHGVPKQLISDRGSGYTSADFASFTSRWRVKHIFASAAHPETNGLVEKLNGTLTATIAAYVDVAHSNWEEKLPEAVFSINTSKQTTTEITPFELVYGRTAILSHELAFPWPTAEIETNAERYKKVLKWRRVARALIIRRQKKSKTNYDRYRKPDPVYRPGELVLVARNISEKGKTKKFLPKFVGPYQVVKRVSKTCYLVEDIPANRKKRIHRRFNVHAGQIRRFHSRSETEWRPDESSDSDSDDEEDGLLFEHVSAVDENTSNEAAAVPSLVNNVGDSASPTSPPPSVNDADAAAAIAHSLPLSDQFSEFAERLPAVTRTRAGRLTSPVVDKDFHYY